MLFGKGYFVCTGFLVNVSSTRYDHEYLSNLIG